MAKTNWKIGSVIIINLQSLMAVFCFILIFLFISSAMGFGIPTVYPLIPKDIKYIVEKLYLDLYEFHFANITFYFIILSGQYIKKFYRLNVYLLTVISGNSGGVNEGLVVFGNYLV